MSRKHDKTGRSKGTPRHVRLYHWMLKSPAWAHLGALEVAIYLEIVSRYAGEGSNNGRIGYSVREAAARFKIGKTTASRAIHKLEETGFIVCTTKGGFNVKIRRATEWRLTEFRCDVSGEMASKDFMRWQPTVPVAKPKAQNTVPVAGPTVPVVGQHGTHSGTTGAENAREGTCSGTVKADSEPPTVPVEGHLYVYQGGSVSEGASPLHHSKRGRSALSKGAVASPRVPAIETPPVATSHLMETTYMRRAALKVGQQ